MTDKTFFKDFLFYSLGLGWTVEFTNDDNDCYWYDFTKQHSEYSFRCYVSLSSNRLTDMTNIKSFWTDFCGPGGFEGDRDMDHKSFDPQGFLLHLEEKISKRELEDRVMDLMNPE